ncbi:MAG: nucleobase:cation symporter-2 family protein [Conchiformibius sp.]|nr:nucleobase:cation symporter-2 family protein [Conchiformibius sp.]
MADSNMKAAAEADLVYKLEDKPPFLNSLVSAVTHLLAIFVPMVTPALIVGSALKLPVEMTAYLVSMAMVASGIGTFLQVNRFGPVGSGMLSIQSVNFSFVGVMISLGLSMRNGGLDENAMISTLLGVSFAGAFLVCGAAWVLPYLKRVITPTVSGVVVLLIGLSLIDVGITDFGGGFGAKGTDAFGSWQNIGLASFVLVIVLVFNCLRNPFLRMSGIAVGLVAGYIAAWVMGMVDFSPLQNAPVFTVPVPFKYGFAFDWGAFLVAATIYLLSVFEAVGDLTATAMVSAQPYEGDEFQRRLRGGVFADGLVSVIATALGSLPLTTFAQNNGVIQMTGVASRHVGKFIAVILVLAGLFPVVGRVFTTIPAPVLGGAMVLMFGLIAIAGVRIIMTNGINRREAVIAATAVGIGLGVAFEPEVFKMLPEVFRNAIAAGGITAVLLNLILPRDTQDKAVYLSD